MDLKFRKVDASDVDLYFEWVNDSVVRDFSYNKASVPYENHVKWFQSRINYIHCLMLIFFDENENSVGQVRIEPTQLGQESIIGLSIAAGFRGKGIGSHLISMATEYYFQNFAEKLIKAFIFKNNISSIKSFIKAGYVILEEKEIEKIPSVILVRRKND